MKRKLFLTFVCLAFFVGAVYAQDVITKRNGEDIKAKVTEVSTSIVKYIEYIDGPVQSIYASDVFKIKYKDGSRDVFEIDPDTKKISVKHFEAETPTPTPTPPTPLPVKRVSNGTFEMLACDGASVSFRAVVETPVYSVSLVSGKQTVKASTIYNTKGNMRYNGTITKDGSTRLFNSTGIQLLKNTEVQCGFKDVPAGFVPKQIVFLTGKNAAPMSYDLVAGAWIKPKPVKDPDKKDTKSTIDKDTKSTTEQTGQSIPKPVASDTFKIQTSEPPIDSVTQEPLQDTLVDRPVPEKTVTEIKFPGGSCKLKKVNINTSFPFFTDKKNNNFDVELRYTVKNADGKRISEVLNILYEQGRFVAPDGTSYKAGAAFTPDKGSIYYLIATVPKNVDVMTLKFVFDGQILELQTKR
jgi:hypothetical protein